MLVDVSSVDDEGRRIAAVQELEQGDGQGVDLLSRRAAGHPDPQAVRGAAVLHDGGKSDRLQRLEPLRLAKERGHADQKVLIQRLHGRSVMVEGIGVAAQAVVVSQEDAPQDAPLDAGPFEVAEVDRMAGAQQLEDAVELRGGGLRLPLALPRAAAAGDAHQPLGDAGWRQHEVRRDGGRARHDVELRGLRILREGDASRVVNGLQSQRAVRVIAGKNHADGVAGPIVRQRTEEFVQRTMRHSGRTRHEPKDVALNGHLGIGRDHVNVVALDRHPVRDFLHRNGRGPGKDVDEQTVMARIEVLDQHESQSGLGGNGGNELEKCVEPSGRGADADDLHEGVTPGESSNDHRLHILSELV